MRQRPPSKARITWRVWMPWYEFSRIVGEIQDHDEAARGALTAAAILAASTLVIAFALPALAFPLIIAGGFGVVGVLTHASTEGVRLVAGLRAEGAPSPRTILRLTAEIVAQDARTLWHGHQALDVAPLTLLLEGEIVAEDRSKGGLDYDADTPTAEQRKQPGDRAVGVLLPDG